MRFLFTETRIPTKTPIVKLPRITSTLDIEIFQSKKSTSVISEFWIENIIISDAKNIAISVFSFIGVVLKMWDTN